MQLVHPNICTTYEFGKWRGHYFIAMEYVEGATLRQILQRLHRQKGRMPVPLVLYVFARVAAALEYAHEARDSRRKRLGVVHRDVSPQNIMVRFDGVVKLLDFGVAKVQQTEEDHTQSTSVKGKFGYLAPEQCVAGRVDARTDVFALGIVLWETLTGRRLYKRESQYETFKSIIEDDVPKVSDLAPEVGDEVDEILTKAMAKSPADRFQSAGEMQQALEELLAKRGQVVNDRNLRELVRPLFAKQIEEGPQLTIDETVVRRLRPSSLHPERTSSNPAVVAPAGRPKWIAPALAALVVAFRIPAPK